MLSYFVHHIFSLNCSDVYEWQVSCLEPRYSNLTWAKNFCKTGNYWDQPCEIYKDVECDGIKYFKRKSWCPVYGGKSYSISVLLSFFLGMFGADRMYFGYLTIGLLKFFTFGFFFIGYIADIVAFVTQIVQPVDGSGISVYPNLVFISNSPHNDIV